MSKKGGGGGVRQAEGAELKRMREEAGMTQEDAARILGIKALAVSRKERGVSAFTQLERERLVAAYGERLADGPRPDTQAPPQAEAAGAEVIPEELRANPVYWRGRQDELVGMMEHIGQSMRQVTAMHDRALETQRLIMKHTTLKPVVRQKLPMRKVDTTPRPGRKKRPG